MHRIKVLIFAGALLLAPRLAWAGADANLPGERAYGYHGSCSSSGVDGGGIAVPRCSCDSDGYFYVRGFTNGLSGSLTTTSKIVRFTPRIAVPGTSADNCSVRTMCTVLTKGKETDDANLTFATGTLQPMDLGTLGCVVNQKCSFETAGTAIDVIDNQTTSACASAGCTEKEYVCKIEIDGDAANAFVGTIDISSEKTTFNP